MLASDYATPGNPFPGSVDWGAAHILRLLEEEEERRRRMSWADSARHPVHPPRSSVPPGKMRPQPGIYAWEQAEIERSMDDESGATLSSPSDRYRQGTAPGGVEMARAWIGQPQAGIPEDELFITPREIFDLGISFLPVIGDAYGLYQDIDTFNQRSRKQDATKLRSCGGWAPTVRAKRHGQIRTKSRPKARRSACTV